MPKIGTYVDSDGYWKTAGDQMPCRYSMLARNVTFMSDVVYIFYKFDKSASKKSSHIYLLFFCFVFRLGFLCGFFLFFYFFNFYK